MNFLFPKQQLLLLIIAVTWELWDTSYNNLPNDQCTHISPAAIEGDYTGPCLEEGKVTLKFAQDLMETFRDQKKLHRKFAYQVRETMVF